MDSEAPIEDACRAGVPDDGLDVRRQALYMTCHVHPALDCAIRAESSKPLRRL